MLEAQKLKIHDNTDGDLIIINKSKLAHHLHLVKGFYLGAGTSLAWLGLSVAFFSSALLANQFMSLGPVSGDTIRALFLMLGLISLLLFGYFAFKWLKFRDQHAPDKLVGDLLADNPIALDIFPMKFRPNKKEGE